MPRKRPERVTVWLTPAQRSALASESRADGLPISRLIEQLVAGHLLGRANHGKTRSPPRPAPPGFHQPSLFDPRQGV